MYFINTAIVFCWHRVACGSYRRTVQHLEILKAREQSGNLLCITWGIEKLLQIELKCTDQIAKVESERQWF